jgi:predicted transcriptional regulator
MPLVSVKLAESTKSQVAQLAERRGVTAHAVMVQAIESALAQAQVYDQFVDDAVAASKRLAADGRVVDGPAFAAYLRAKAAGDSQAVRPLAKSLSGL